MKDGFLKAAAVSPSLKVADVDYNKERIIDLIGRAEERGIRVLVFPELAITGYTLSDLFFQSALQRKAEKALEEIASFTSDKDLICFVGYPLMKYGKLYNALAAMHRGKVIAFFEKVNMPSYGEFYETRWFTPSSGINEYVSFGGYSVISGSRILLHASDMPELTISAEICEDLWVPDPPSVRHALAGADLIVNASASDEIVGKSEYRRNLVSMQSARLVSAYIYANASEGESTTDMVFTGSNIIAENGTVLAEREYSQDEFVVSDIDLGRLVFERSRMNTFPSSGREGYDTVEFRIGVSETVLERTWPRFPFVPSDDMRRKERCERILTLQALGLKKRIVHTGARSAVVGLSGGLDSTLALLVTARAFDLAGRDRKDIIAITMPCFGTTARTKGNAEKLAEALGVTLKVIDIRKSVIQHFEDIGQSLDDLSVTYENGQARERTQVLMDVANKTGGMVIGTGDLSELALGWATYNGDHMSMYGVNASIPKTLVRYLVSYVSSISGKEVSSVLDDILSTPVSPELLPAKDGVISQVTEDIVGPYELHDFFLYYMVRQGYSPKKIYRVARHTFEGVYSDEEILKWLRTFVRRFFSQQFKRSCLPDGPKVGSLTLSPRSDWRMPSDASSALWMDELV
ncbi:MAG: NAD(+) synthase [Candidatus Ornithospirochaeta sp.]|nr:NAD(+) synthase [Candidatus Ornithospirochaeta sp.]